jgi:hypothetical protein
VLVTHVLARLDATDCAMLAQVAKPWLAVVLANKLPRAGKEGAVKLELQDFVGSAATLAWAKANGCQWDERTCAQIARSGQLEVLVWARANNCPWDEDTCSHAATGGHLNMLRWARENDCPWNSSVCYTAAGWGHLDVLQWALGQECPFDEDKLCAAAMDGGDEETRDWMEEEGFFAEDYFPG